MSGAGEVMVTAGAVVSPFATVTVTGIDKRPVAGPVAVCAPGPKGTGAVGLAGDRVYDVAHHGGDDQAVYAYAREELDVWAARLGRELPDGGIELHAELSLDSLLDGGGLLIRCEWKERVTEQQRAETVSASIVLSAEGRITEVDTKAGAAQSAADKEALRTLVAGWFLLVCPGMALVQILRLQDGLMTWVLAIALILAALAIFVLLVVVVVTVAKPARAEAVDLLTALGIASLVVIGLMVVAYLIIASTAEPKTAQVPQLYAAASADAPAAP